MSVVEALKELELNNKQLMVACSGGLDSTVLVHALASLNIQATLLHVNYHLRGDASDKDQVFVENLGASLNFPVRIEHCPKAILYGEGKNLQNEARKFRKRFFEDWINKSEQHLVLLGHHGDDQVETFFLQLARGAGLFGLGGMHGEKDQIIRPFLKLNKKTLNKYAVINGITWREDQSNEGVDYLRNRFRNVFLPEMEKEVPNLRSSILLLQEFFRNEQEMLNQSIYDVIQDWKNKGEIDLIKWQQLEIEQKIAFIKAIEASQWTIKRIDEAKNLQLSSEIDLGFTSLVKVKNTLKQVLTSKNHLLWDYKIESIEFLPNTFSNREIYLDAALINGDLHMRFASKDDVIYPIGMRGKQNVFKILKDSGVPFQERSSQQILCDDNYVLWIPNLKTARNAIAGPQSKSIFKIQLIEKKKFNSKKIS